MNISRINYDVNKTFSPGQLNNLSLSQQRQTISTYFSLESVRRHNNTKTFNEKGLSNKTYGHVKDPRKLAAILTEELRYVNSSARNARPLHEISYNITDAFFVVLTRT